eukprot:TRINITY_DN9880_c1_g1_i1.p1 TRINITY_DN9880_c1_g1~~TRINITY_DN9880_c1_g1_i1.p1  ORF type:complete len:1372 (-),score=364.27 TRINITY_DN9880_c1_g1_i1:40-3942(-)
MRTAVFRLDDETLGLSSAPAPAEASATAPTGEVAPAGTQAPKKKKKKGSSLRPILVEFQRLFGELALSNKRAASTEQLTRSFGWDSSITSQQHDVQELNRVLFDVLKQSLQGTSSETLIDDMYKGTITNYILCKSCGYRRDIREDFFDVSLIVKDFEKEYSSVEAALAAFVAPTFLDGNNQWECGGCMKKVDAAKGTLFETLPDILTLSLNRFVYDWQEDKRVKLNHAIAFPVLLDMSPFVSASTAAGVPNIFELFSVVIHQGGAYGGHYHAYICDLSPEGAAAALLADPPQQARGQWYDFDDSRVSPISEATLATQVGGRGECAYMLFYRRRHDSAPETVHPPPRIVAEMAEANKVLENERTDYETLLHKVEVTVYHPSAVMVVDGTVHLVDRLLSGAPGLSASTAASAAKAAAAAGTVDRLPELQHFQPLASEPEGDPIDAFDEASRAMAAALEEHIDEPEEREPLIPVAPSSSPTTQTKSASAKPAVPTAKGKPATLPPGVSVVVFDDRDPLSVFPEKILGAVDAASIEGAERELLLLTEMTLRGSSAVFNRSFTLQDIMQREPMTIADAAIIDGAKVLVWNGKDLNGVRMSSDGEMLCLTIRQFVDSETVISHPLSLAASSTVAELRFKIQEITQIPVEDMQLSLMSKYQLEPLLQNSTTLEHAGVVDRAIIAVECLGREGLAMSVWMEEKDLLSLFIYLRLPDSSPSDPPLHLQVDKANTLSMLKSEILRNLRDPAAKAHNMGNTRLRQYLPGGGEGGLYGDESRSLHSIGATTGSAFVFESGEAPSVSSMSVKFHYAPLRISDASAPPVDVIVDRTWTLQRCKEAMANQLHLDAANLRLRETDFWEQPGRLLSDETVTLDRHGVRDGDLFWLEDGSAPVKGQISLIFQLLHDPAALPAPQPAPAPAPAPAPSPSPASPVKPAAATPKRLGGSASDSALSSRDMRRFLWGSSVRGQASAPAPAPAPAPAQTETVPILVEQPFSLLSKVQAASQILGQLDVSGSLTVNELKAMLIATWPVFQGVPGPEYLRLWDSGRILRQGEQSLKKQHVADNRTLGVQILGHPEHATLRSTHALLLHSHRRDPIAALWSPMREVVFDDGAMPSFANLKKRLSEMYQIPLDTLIVAKLLSTNGRWTILEAQPDTKKGKTEGDDKLTNEAGEPIGAVVLEKNAPPTTEEAEVSSKAKSGASSTKGGPKVADNVRGHPFYLRDGDTIAVKDLRDDTEGHDDFGGLHHMSNYYWSNGVSSGSKNGSSGEPGGKKKRYRSAEVGIRILGKQEEEEEEEEPVAAAAASEA